MAQKSKIIEKENLAKKHSRRVTPIALYGKGHSYKNNAKKFSLLTELVTKPENTMTPLEKMNMASSGIRKSDLVNLKEKAKLDYDKLAKALAVTRATLINKKGKAKFSVALSERIVGLADIYSYGYAVFEDVDRFNQWMFRANKALGGQIPYDIIGNQFGREEVKNIIGRIDYGVYS